MSGSLPSPPVFTHSVLDCVMPLDLRRPSRLRHSAATSAASRKPNPMWAALTGDPSEQRGMDRNVAWRHFTNAPSVIDFDDAHAEEFSDDLTADLREAAGRYPSDPALNNLITQLHAASPDFADRWRQARIARHRSSRKTATHTSAGPITIDCDVLTAPGIDLRIVMYTATSGTEDASKLELLRVHGIQALTS